MQTGSPAIWGTKMASWLVVGSSGFVGRGIVRQLEEQGHTVTGLRAPRLQVRPDRTAEQLVEVIDSEVSKLEHLTETFRGHDIVVNAAGVASPDSDATGALYGANAVLPGVIASLCRRAPVGRFIHISSVAVQGRRRVLDDSDEYQTFSPYSSSKAQGELVLLTADAGMAPGGTAVCIVRATSVQGVGRKTTDRLRRFASSRFASVPGQGSSPSPVSTLEGLAAFVERLGSASSPLPRIVVQPWEGKTVREVLVEYGNKEPAKLPHPLCKAMIMIGYAVTRTILPSAISRVRQLEVLWYGQRIAESSGSGGERNHA